MNNFRDFIDRYWPSTDAMAKDLRLPVSKVRHWKTRNVVPVPELWLAVIKAARKRGFKGDANDLARIAARKLKTNGGAEPEAALE